MCAGAMAMARIGRLVFAACDPKGGAVLHGPRFFEQPTCHHRPAITQTEPHAMEAGEILKEFFRARRRQNFRSSFWHIAFFLSPCGRGRKSLG